MQLSINNVRFRFNQSMQLPHFSMSGDFDAKTKRVPTVSVRWYAKGGILTSPTIFGVQGGQLLGGGESGPEAVTPIDNIKDYMRDVLQEEDRNAPVYNIYIDGIKYNTDDYINRTIDDFVKEMLRKGAMYSG